MGYALRANPSYILQAGRLHYNDLDPRFRGNDIIPLI